MFKRIAFSRRALSLCFQAALLSGLVTGTSAAQSIGGSWEGVVGGERISVRFDSSGSGWRGTLLVPALRKNSVGLTAVVVGSESSARPTRKRFSRRAAINRRR